MHMKIFYETKKMLVPFVCEKHRCVLHVNIYLSLFQVLSDVRTAIHRYEHVSAGIGVEQTHAIINSTIG